MFIVIEGLDGAGKSTQVAKIKEFFAERGFDCEYLHFPRFDAPVYGELIARFLRGELGSLEGVNPYLVALMYAGDRSQAATLIQGWIDENRVVIVDRYVYSNIAYQCAKIEQQTQRSELTEWILNLEYEVNRIPQPDLTLFLDVPFGFTRKKLTEEREGDDRGYLKGKQDIHEASLSFQEQVRRVYLEVAPANSLMRIVNCSDDQGEMLPADMIFEKIVHEIKTILL